MTPEFAFLLLLSFAVFFFLSGYAVGKKDGKETRRFLRDRAVGAEMRLQDAEAELRELREAEDWWKG